MNGSGDTLLHLAARHSHSPVVCMLVDDFSLQPNEVNSRNLVGHTPLHEAALSSCVACVEKLLAANADIHIAKHGKNSTPSLSPSLHSPPFSSCDAVALSRHYPADWTALHLAATKPCVNVIQLLLRAGADASRVNKDGVCVCVSEHTSLGLVLVCISFCANWCKDEDLLCLPACLSTCLSACLSVHLSVCPPVCLSPCLSVSLSADHSS